MSDQGEYKEEEPPDPLLGRVIAHKLQLLQLLGAGAMGKVYRAHHQALDKIVAIKVLHSQEGIDPQRLLRFKAEARAASRLDHPNSVQILDFGEDGKDQLLYIAMEFLEGQDLQNVLQREGPMPVDRALIVMMQVLAALGAAHDKGVVHRDMKPSNVMLLEKRTDDGTPTDLVKVCDFGLAKIVDRAPNEEGSSGPLTKQGAVFGTPTYMSPEQARGDVLDSRSDLYSAGVILYRMIAGQVPFSSETAWGILMKHMTEEPEPMTALVPGLDPRVEAIVQKAMVKDKTQRFQTAREMRLAIRTVLRDLGAEGEWDLEPLPGSRSPSRAVPSNPEVVATRAASGLRPQSIPQASGAESSVNDATFVPSRQSAPAGGSGSQPPARTMPMQQGPSSQAALPAAALQTFAPADAWKSTAPPRTFNPWVAMVPGMMALVLVGGLLTYVLLGNKSNNAPPAVTPTVAAASGSSGAMMPIAPEPAMKAEPQPMKAEPSEMKAEPTPAMKAEDPISAKANPRGKRGSKSHGKSEEALRAEVAHEPPVKTEPVAAVEATPAPVAAPVPAPAAPVPAAPVPAPAPAPAAPAGPKKLSAQFSVDAELAEVNVGGGLSKRQSEDGLKRQLGAAKACLQTALAKNGVEAKGRVQIKATVDVRGRLEAIHSSGAPGSGGCIEEALSQARLPPPDTGEARISFELQYHTVD